MSTTRRLLAALLVVAVLTAACSRRPAPRPKASESTSNELPRGFPQDFPLPADWEVVFSAALPTGVSAYFNTSASSEDVRALLLSRLPKQGWTLVSCSAVPSTTGGVTQQVVATNSGVLGTIDIGGGPQVPGRSTGSYKFSVTLIRTSGAAVPVQGGCA